MKYSCIEAFFLRFFCGVVVIIFVRYCIIVFFEIHKFLFIVLMKEMENMSLQWVRNQYAGRFYRQIHYHYRIQDFIILHRRTSYLVYFISCRYGSSFKSLRKVKKHLLITMNTWIHLKFCRRVSLSREKEPYLGRNMQI